MSKDLRKSYLKHLGRHFPGAGVLFPVNQKAELGDYGFFQKGRFVIKGNVFKHHGLKLDKFINQELKKSPKVNYLLYSDKASVFHASTKMDAGPLFKISSTFEFHAKKSFILQLYKMQMDNIYIKTELEEKLISLSENRQWVDEYRLVVQRQVTNSLKFSFSRQKQSKITLQGESKQEAALLKDLSLKIDYSKTENMATDMWVDESEIQLTPLVRLAKLTGHGIDEFSYNLGASDDHLVKLYESPRLVIDNSDSFPYFDELEEWEED